MPLSSELLGICPGGACAPRRLARRVARGAADVPLRAMASRWLRPRTVGMDTQRLILLFIFGFSVLMLWEAWEREHQPKPPAHAEQRAAPKPPSAASAAPTPSPGAIGTPASAAQKGES